MKRWPLRWKLAFYAAALAVVATLAGAATTWTIMRYWELKAFDQRLALDAQELFRDVENFEGGLADNSRVVPGKIRSARLCGTGWSRSAGPAASCFIARPIFRRRMLQRRHRKISYSQDRWAAAFAWAHFIGTG